MLNKVKVLVTGSSGLIGRAIIPELLSKGYAVRAQVRDLPGSRAEMRNVKGFETIEFIECDFVRACDADFNKLVNGCSTIIHLAGLVHQPNAAYEQYELLNVRTTEQLVNASVANGVETFILFSTSAVYGVGPFIMADENKPLKTDTPYALSKRQCENIVQNCALKRVVSLRPALVFGAGDRGNLIRLIKSIKKRRYVHIGSGQSTKSLIYAKDLAKAVALCLDKLPEGKYTLNVANPEAVSLKRLATEISIALGQSEFVPMVPEVVLRAFTTITDKLLPGVLPVTTEQLNKISTTTTISVNNLVELTGFQPQYSLLAALKEEIDWALQKKLL